ncbi:MAG: hydroxymethylbilane synthase [Gammaproteobacteria bacterium]|nr:hydroxymethylbilane synthase [Gammaproteobacteria bacterium]
MSLSKLRIATRKSLLALWQAEHIAQKISAVWPQIDIELVPMVTSGDRFANDKTLPESGKGLFVKELETALLDNRADIAVHSMKDVPAAFPDGLGIQTITTRDNPYDAFVSHQYASIEALPLNARIGTSSLRRQSQLLLMRPDLNIEVVRGNIHTRLEKLRSTPFDGIILAAAGLMRMDLQAQISEIIPKHLMLPACGQGALGVEARLNDKEIQTLLASIHDQNTALCVSTERHVNAKLGGNCHVPVAVYCHLEQTQLELQAKVLTADGQHHIDATCSGTADTATQMADRCAQELFDKGAKELLQCL